MESKTVSFLGRLLDLDILEKDFLPVLRKDEKFMDRVRYRVTWILQNQGLKNADESIVMQGIKMALVEDLFYCRTHIPWKKYKAGDLMDSGWTMDQCKTLEEDLRMININELYHEREKLKTSGVIAKYLVDLKDNYKEVTVFTNE